MPIAFLGSAWVGLVLERSLYVHVYRKNHLDQVLFTIGLVFMSVAAVDYIMGSSQVFVQVPPSLQGSPCPGASLGPRQFRDAAMTRSVMESQ